MLIKSILVTGGAGFIGSHTTVELLRRGYHVVVVDDLSNSSRKVEARIGRIVGTELSRNMEFVIGDVSDEPFLSDVFSRHDIDAVIHFAGFKAVGESVKKPIEYYSNNIGTTTTLLRCMNDAGCRSLVFSSSATVYGDSPVPFVETMEKQPATSPYGWTKWMIEQILSDVSISDERWNIVLLRYFNPIGADESGLIGEDPRGVPNNLLPYVSQVAVGRRPCVRVFGDDYETHDGTGARDYIHVSDLADGHVDALRWMDGRHGVETFNLGTGRSETVLDVIHAFERACGHEIPYEICPRRPGDLPEYYADASKARDILGWTARRDIDDMCADSWRWQSDNPNGYDDD